ncbi:MAG: hypothetical protein JW801_13145 [Bacteroidales bacterium]|nr:hypothetical protein [Bacteroidales bacterium]
MKQILYIQILLLTTSMVISAQTQQGDPSGWFGNETLSIGNGKYSSTHPEEGFGDFRLIGWSETGLIAYLFNPMTSVACETEETLYIYDLVNNYQVWRKFACSVDWTDPQDRTVKECIGKLTEYQIKPATAITLKPMDTKIERADSTIKVFQIKGDQQLLLASLKLQKDCFSMLEADGYLVSPLNENLYAVLLPYLCDIEDVCVLGWEGK